MTTRLNALADRLTGASFGLTNYSNLEADVNYLAIAGGDLAAVAAGNTLAITNSFHRVTAATGNVDSITDILGLAGGQPLRLHFTNAQMLRNNGGGTGNIRTLSGSDRAVKANEIVELTYDSAGAVWREIAPSSLLGLIADSRLGADAASWDVQNIPGNPGDALSIDIAARAAAAADQMRIRMNNDTGSNYKYIRFYGTQTGTNSGGANTATGAAIDEVTTGSSAPAGYASAVHVELPGYAGTDYNKAFVGRFVDLIYDGSNSAAGIADGEWISTAAITRLTVYLSGGGNIKAASRLGIWRKAIA